MRRMVIRNVPFDPACDFCDMADDYICQLQDQLGSALSGWDVADMEIASLKKRLAELESKPRRWWFQ